MASSSHRETTIFRFLDLPPELRIIVYSFYISSFELKRTAHCKDRKGIQAPLLNTCEQVRKEAIAMYKSHIYGMKREVWSGILNLATIPPSRKWRADRRRPHAPFNECIKETENVSDMVLQWDIEACGGREAYDQMWEEFFEACGEQDEEGEEGEELKLSFEE